MSNPNERAEMVKHLRELQKIANAEGRYVAGSTLAAAISEIESISGNWTIFDTLRETNRGILAERDALRRDLANVTENRTDLRHEVDRTQRAYEGMVAEVSKARAANCALIEERDAEKRAAARANKFAEQQRASYLRMQERVYGTRPANRRPIPQGGENRTLIDALTTRVREIEAELERRYGQ